ncbi:unnamed protein product [Nyctereutes procyonoides]|uniref:(raccoon dog) hypothetical protein n=1 Tax=Nyctereutes procyonoides TaxID=34880 RepID=A0A811ZEY3_NYCPR|nr:unnamed protein product [Nyctereutes procyonoides]
MGRGEDSVKQEANGQCDMPRKSFNTYSWQEIQRHNQEANRNPGGHQVLNHYAGQDATDVFRAMNLDFDIVKLYLKSLFIGELAPQKNFQELRRTLESMNMFKANLVFFLHLGQSSFLQHDLGHLSMFTKSKWNSKWWNHRHFQHHIKPNTYPKDPDVDVGPLFLVGDSQPVKFGKKKIKYINYEKQHLYFYMMKGNEIVFGAFNCQSFSLQEIPWISSFYIHYFITLGPFYGILRTILFLESPWLIYATQMSHIAMKTSKEENQDWLSTQVLATCNAEQSFFNDYLFPTMPRHNYHKVAPLVRSLCAKHGLPYVNKPMLKAFGDIAKFAALWMDAYYETFEAEHQH